MTAFRTQAPFFFFGFSRSRIILSKSGAMESRLLQRTFRLRLLLTRLSLLGNGRFLPLVDIFLIPGHNAPPPPLWLAKEKYL